MVGAGSAGALNHTVGALASLGHLQGQGANPDAELSQEEDDDSMQLVTRMLCVLSRPMDLSVVEECLHLDWNEGYFESGSLKVLSSGILASSHRDRNFRKRRRRRADVAQWTDPAVKILIGVLRVLRHSFFEEGEKVSSSQVRAIGGSNKQIWKSVAKALQAQGHNFDAGQCKTKFKGLKTEYHSTMEALGIADVHSNVDENLEQDPTLGDDVREKIRKFKNFQDMRGYFMGLPVTDEESFFNGEKPHDFLRNLDRFKDVHRQNHDSDKDENYLDRLLTLPIDQETIERRDGRFPKRKSSDRLPPSVPSLRSSKQPPPVQSNPQPPWPMSTSLADEGVSGGDMCITQIPIRSEDPKKRKEMSSQRVESSSTLERESRLQEEYRAKKLILKERKVSLAEKNLDLEMLKAENEKHRLANEEKRLKYQEDQLSSFSTTITLLTTLISKNFRDICTEA